MSRESHTQTITLFRGGSPVSSLASAQGRGLRETRLTALLGYLISLNPNPFLRLFQFSGDLRNVTIEHREIDGRSDIRVETNRGIGLIEAKVSAVDPSNQAARYEADWVAYLTRLRTPKSRRTELATSRFVSWEDLVEVLTAMASSKQYQHRFVAEDLLRYLREHNMVSQAEHVEIYAREINDSETLNMFLHAQMYGCWYEKNSRLPESMYFAPHFGQKIALQIPGIHAGISYIAKINEITNVRTWRDFEEAIRDQQGKTYLKKHQEIFKSIRIHWKWNNLDKDRSILFLGKPRLVFNPPIKKDNLQEGKGWLSRRFLSFDELFEAWKK